MSQFCRNLWSDEEGQGHRRVCSHAGRDPGIGDWYSASDRRQCQQRIFQRCQFPKPVETPFETSTCYTSRDTFKRNEHDSIYHLQPILAAIGLPRAAKLGIGSESVR